MTKENEQLARRVEDLLDDVAAMRSTIADVDVPGWVIGKPTISELTEDLAIMVARSKPGDSAPFFLPGNSEASIAVLEGSVRVESDGESSVIGHRFFIVSPGRNRRIFALEAHTRIYMTLFRSRVADESAMARR